MWEGNLTRYNADGDEISRESTVLFLYVDSDDDRLKLRTNQLPNVVKIRLHNCVTGREVYGRHLNGENFIRNGVFFHPKTGNACMGHSVIGMGGAVFEMLLNRWEGDEVVGRLRAVFMFGEECVIKMSVFRERKGGQSVHEKTPEPEIGSIGNEVCGGVGEEVTMLLGDWKVQEQVYAANDQGDSHTAEWTERRRLRQGLLLVNRGEHGERGERVGHVSHDGKCVMMTSTEDRGEERLLFVGGGASLMFGLNLAGSADQEFAVELAWMVSSGKRVKVARTYRGLRWTAARFATETRVGE